MSVNVWTFSGRLTSLPQSKEVGDSTVYKFNVAVNDYAGKDKENSVVFVECDLWGNRGKYLLNFDKGAGVTVTGKLTVRTWVNKENVEKTVLGCRVTDYVFHSKYTDEEPVKEKSKPKTNPKPKPEQQEPENNEDDDIPF